MEKAQIDRINALSKKARTEGLTPEETEERAVLRQNYLKAFRGQMVNQLESIVLVDENGNRRPLKKN